MRPWMTKCVTLLCVCLCADAAPGDAVKAELSTKLPGGAISLAPVRSMAEDSGCEVIRSGNELVFRLSGTTNNEVTIRTDGGITIRDTRPVRSLKDVDRLNQDLATVVDYIERVSAAIPADAKLHCLCYGLIYRLDNPGIFQRMVFMPGDYEGKVHVPKCKVAEARFVALPSGYSRLEFRDRNILSGARETSKVAEIRDQLVFGDHALKIASGWYSNPIALEVVTLEPAEKISYSGGGPRLVLTPVNPLGARPAARDTDGVSTGTPGEGESGSSASEPESAPSGTYRIRVDRKSIIDLAGQIKAKATDATAESRKVVAIADFELIADSDNREIDRVVARMVREDLTTAMADLGVFRVVERSQLAEALKNLRLDQTAIIDETTAKEIGRLVAADYVLIGSLSDRGKTVVVNGRMIDAETGMVKYSASVETVKDEVGVTAPTDIDAIKERIAADPTEAQNYVDLAEYWLAKGDNSQCAQAMGKALHLDPDRFKPSSSVFDRLSRLSAKRGDLLAPYVGVVTMNGGKLTALTDGSIYHPFEDKVFIEVVDDTAIAEVKVFVNDSPFANSTTCPRGHAALLDVSDMLKKKTAGTKSLKLEVNVTDGSGKNGRQVLKVRVGK